ncbi:MAG: hypothetical protein ACFCD0_01455 [Gemmataceae bacterium]
MDAPFYNRSEDHNYFLRSNPEDGWWTGVVHDEIQFLRTPTVVLQFDRHGKIVNVEDAQQYPVPPEWENGSDATADCSESWPSEMKFEECPIKVKRFWLPDHAVGIEDMPEVLAEFYTKPDSFEMSPDDVKDWENGNRFVFHCAGIEEYMNRKGEVEDI